MRGRPFSRASFFANATKNHQNHPISTKTTQINATKNHQDHPNHSTSDFEAFFFFFLSNLTLSHDGKEAELKLKAKLSGI